MEGVPYKARVGSLMPAMVVTRVDIAFALSAVSAVSQFMSKASPPHWIVVKHIMRLKGTMEFKLCLKGKDINLRGFCNADWAGDANDQRFTSRYIYFVGIGIISWKCKKQPTIVLSTTETEYMTISHCTKETVWLRQVLADVGYVQEGPRSIMCDNQGCIALAKKPTHHSRIKHIDVQHHFIRDRLENQETCLKYCPTEDIIVGVLRIGSKH